jgi:acyl-coenzyme A thioesterase PaaI-like protein
MRTFDARIDLIAPGRVVLSMPITQAAGQQHGFAHAGATFALGDSASGYAALSLMDPGAEVLTVEMKINLIAPASGPPGGGGRGRETGPAPFRGAGDRAQRSEDGTLRDVALLQGTMIPA